MTNVSGIRETVGALAELAGGKAEGETQKVMRGVALTETAGAEDVVYASDARALAQALASSAGCIIVDEKAGAPGHTVIRARDPRLAFARIVARFHPAERPAPGIDPTAVVHPSARIGGSVSVGAFVVIGEGAEIGDECVIGAGCMIGENSRLGAGCRLYPRVTLYPGVTLGARVILHSGVVVGSDGFGYVFNGRAFEKFPQIGTVEIGDDSEIGANTTIDRAAMGVTKIGRGVKIDNLVQVAHNVTIGDHVVIASQTGISGSTVIESYAVVGGQVGLGDHVRIESGARLGSQCGVLPGKTVRKGETVWGTPARPLKEYLANLAVLSRLTKARHH
jgi:UDP-3-O-[3-hydroxymyristoyl] glucosamine N-acyltransferase